MKAIRQRLKEVPVWNSRCWSIRDFTFTVLAGFALSFGVLSWVEGGSVRDPFSLKVSIGCFALAGICVLLASNKVYVLGCAVMVPAALMWFDAIITRNRKILVFCVEDLVFGSLILILGILARSLWRARSSRRSG
jgi:hypothetical protein